MIDRSNLERSLMELSLTEKEAKIYLALLSLESATAYRIADRAKLKRPTVYIVLEELRKKGLILKIPHAKKALYSVRSLAEYIAEGERSVEKARALLPQFEALRAQPGTAVYFYNGLSGIRDALQHKFNEMRDKTYLSFHCSLSDMGKDIRELYDQWDKDAIAIGTRFEIIRGRSDAYEEGEGEKHLTAAERESVEVRYIDTHMYSKNVSFEIGDDFVRITDAKEYFATVIDGRATAEALRQMFAIIWNVAKNA